MADLTNKDASLLLDMPLAARDASAFVAGMDEAAFRASRLHQNAVIRSLEVIGEAAGKVSPGFQAAHPNIPWREITGMRHRLIHGYAEVDLDLVWSVVGEKLGPLLAALAPLIPPEGAPDA
jgi:uncharacterized protein with HEPN domain